MWVNALTILVSVLALTVDFIPSVGPAAAIMIAVLNLLLRFLTSQPIILSAK